MLLLRFSEGFKKVYTDKNYVLVGNLTIFIIAFLILYSRRGEQLTIPQVWDEDGLYLVPQFITEGWLSLLKPVNGYLITLPRLITNIALSISPFNYPFISTLLAWIFTACICVYILSAPTFLRYRFICALAILFIPSDPECFGIPLYSFWWGGILLILLCLWSNSSKALCIRAITLIVCGLSSPIIVVSAPVFFLRYLVYRNRTECITFTLSLFCAILQLHFIFSLNNPIDNNFIQLISLSNIALLLEKFFWIIYN